MNIKFKIRYQNVLDKFHQVSPKITLKYKYFLAGFLEGEGSCCVSIKNRRDGLGVKVDPEFNICQHINGIIHLIAFMNLFKTGNIRLKSGSPNIFVFKITNRKALKEKFVPYYKQYVLPYACKQKKYNFNLFTILLDLLERKVHLTPEGIAFKILPLVYKMNAQKGKRRKWDLEQLQEKILNKSV